MDRQYRRVVTTRTGAHGVENVVRALIGVVVGALVVTSCGSGSSTATSTTTVRAAFALRSSAFANGAAIPKHYTCNGASVSPPLSWSGAPAGTRAVALIVDDPDAPIGTFVHWVLWGLPPTGSLAEGTVPPSAVQGNNGAGAAKYTGPCPPSGTHHYRFTLYALSRPPDAPAGATAAQLRAAIARTTIATALLVGTYRHQ